MQVLQRKGVNGEVTGFVKLEGVELRSLGMGGVFFPLKYPSCGEAASRALLGLWKQVELQDSEGSLVV